MSKDKETGMETIPGLILDDLGGTGEELEEIEELLIILRFSGQPQPVILDVTNEPLIVNAILVNLAGEKEVKN